jgi:hypothetical protein
MQQLNEQTKQKRAELTSLFGASSSGKLLTKLPININLAAHTVIQANQHFHKLPMHAQLPATLQQQVPTNSVKGLFEINKHHKEALPVVLSCTDKMMQGKDSIKCTVARPEPTLRGGSQTQPRNHTLKALVHEPV